MMMMMMRARSEAATSLYAGCVVDALCVSQKKDSLPDALLETSKRNA